MLRVVIMADPETAEGFRLAGVEVVAASDPEEARVALEALLDDESVGVVAVSESLLPPPGGAARARLDTLVRPIVVSLPVGAALGEGEDRRAYLERMISKMIGFDITLKPEV